MPCLKDSFKDLAFVLRAMEASEDFHFGGLVATQRSKTACPEKLRFQRELSFISQVGRSLSIEGDDCTSNSSFAGVLLSARQSAVHSARVW